MKVRWAVSTGGSKLSITSLNSHFYEICSGTRYGGFSTLTDPINPPKKKAPTAVCCGRGLSLKGTPRSLNQPIMLL
jgi:hypothetical protein